jgi:sugar lactone lactonase YvrE
MFATMRSPEWQNVEDPDCFFAGVEKMKEKMYGFSWRAIFIYFLIVLAPGQPAETKVIQDKQTADKDTLTEMVFERMWPTLLQPWYFNSPRDIALDDNGFVYVVDAKNDEVIKFSSVGLIVTKWGSNCDIYNGAGCNTNAQGAQELGDGQFVGLKGIYVDSSGYVYAADRYNNRIQKFTSNGRFVTKWGSNCEMSNGFGCHTFAPGATEPGDGQFFLPYDVAVDNSGFVYVTDAYNNRVQKFTSDGIYISKWGSLCNMQNGTGCTATASGAREFGDGQFNHPNGIAVDYSGNVYVADSGNHRIQVFTSDGDFIDKWGSACYIKSGIGCDTNAAGAESPGDGQFYGLDKIAVDGTGYVYASDSQNDRIQVFTGTGQFVEKWGSEGQRDGQFDGPGGIAIDKNKNVYVAEIINRRIQKFTPNRQSVNEWGSQGTGNGKFSSPEGIAVDSSNPLNKVVYVIDGKNHRIQKFTSDGMYLGQWGSFGQGEGQFIQPRDIAIDTSDSLNKVVYVVDSNNDRIQKFYDDGTYIGQLGYPNDGIGENFGEFRMPSGIAVDSSGSVYVSESYSTHGPQRIQKFTSNGDFVTAWGSYCDISNSFSCNTNAPGAKERGDGQFNRPIGIAIDSSGFIYVADTDNHRIQKFTSDGSFLTKWGSFCMLEAGRAGGCIDPDGQGPLELGDGQFYRPKSIAIDSSGFINVCDNNMRVQQFTQNGDFIAKYIDAGTAPGLINEQSSLSFDSSDQLYISDSVNNRVQVFKKRAIGVRNKAIIVAGGGPYSGNTLWNATQISANFAYRALTHQGFTTNEIYYLTSDTDLDLDSNGAMDDVDGDATNSNLEQAIINWASDTDNLVLYLTDHGGEATFRMTATEILSASELDSWVDSLQNTIECSVIIVYDACNSGSFLATLSPSSGKDRIVITSTSPGEDAYFIGQGAVSFSNYFWTHIFNGLNIKEAFSLTKDSIQHTTDFQTPLLDANGNGTADEPEDYTLAQNVYIGNGTIIHGYVPVVGSVSDPQTITDTSSATLFASEVTDNDGIARVWATIRPPGYHQGSPDNPVQELPSIDLVAVGGDRYEVTYDKFHITGTFLIAIYAMDRIGNTSIPRITTVSVENPSRRRAIIVAGGAQSDALWPAIETCADLAYKALTFQGYSDDDIYFMSPVTFSTGVDVTPTIRNINDAINTWAQNSTQDVVLYLMGSVDDENFRINEAETLPFADLAVWLDNLQTVIPGKVTVICDAEKSGSFLPLLAPPADKDRILVSSTDATGPAYFAIDGNISFSAFFWRQVLNGTNVRDAFIYTTEAVGQAYQGQEPMLDDSGNGLGNEKGVDGDLAGAYTIGAGIMLAGDDPFIGSVCPNQILSGEISATIWVEDVTTTGTIDNVWALIKAPGYRAGDGSTPSEDILTLELNAVGNGRYEVEYGDFSSFGTYKISFYAKDSSGNVSIPKEAQVHQKECIGDFDDDGDVDGSDLAGYLLNSSSLSINQFTTEYGHNICSQP